MPRSLDIDLLRTFLAVADHASMTAAGKARALTQSAVSQQVKRLEEQLSAPLFRRARAALSLTPSGEALLPRARALVALNDAVLAEMTAETLGGRVRFGVPYDLVGTCLPPILKAFAAAHPRVAISLTCGSSPELRRALRQGELDIALAEAEVGRSAAECLRIEPLVWVGARGGSAQLRQPLPVSMVAESCAFRPAVMTALEDGQRAWRTVFENGNIDATTATVRADLAVTVWLACTVPSDLVILPPASGLPALPHYAINLHLPRRQPTQQALALAGHVRHGLAAWPQAA